MITVIIGSNSVVTKSVPKGSTIDGITAKIIGYVDELTYDISDNLFSDNCLSPYMINRNNK